MSNMVDVQGLPEKDVKLDERLVENGQRTQAKREEETRTEEDAEIAFAVWPLGAKVKSHERGEVPSFLNRNFGARMFRSAF